MFTCVCAFLEGSRISKTKFQISSSSMKRFKFSTRNLNKNRILRFRTPESSPTRNLISRHPLESEKKKMAGNVILHRDANFPFSSCQNLIILKLGDYRYRLPSYFQNNKETQKGEHFRPVTLLELGVVLSSFDEIIVDVF